MILIRVALPLLALLSLLSVSCATGPDKPKVPTAPMDVALDTAGEGMLYAGTGYIPRGFNSPDPFRLEFDLKRWGGQPGNEASAAAAKAYGESFPKSGTFQPAGEGRGIVTMTEGRLQLRGEVRDEGREFGGEWFFDDLEAGSFRIVRKGFLFP